MNLAQSALFYATKFGWHVFPLQPGEKEPFPGTHSHLDATDDPDQIEAWWKEHPDANIGLALEASGLCLIDLDPRNGGDPNSEFWTSLPPTLEILTGEYEVGGKRVRGLHRLYRANGQQVPAHPVPGVDAKTRGYSILPPSLHPSGVTYEIWSDTSFADQPEIVSTTTTSTGPNFRRGPQPEEIEMIPRGERNVGLTAIAGRYRAMGMTRDELYGSLSMTNAVRCDPPLDEAEVRSIATSVSNYIADTELWTRGETFADVVYPDFAQRDLTDEIEEKKAVWKLRTATEVVTEDQIWLDRPFIPVAEATILGGHGGIGKTTYTTVVSADLSRGQLGGDFYGTPYATAFFAGGEDSFEKHILPSFLASGGDPKYLHEISVPFSSEEEGVVIEYGPPAIPGSLSLLRQGFKEHPEIKLLIIDPVLAFAETKRGTNDANEVRKIVHSLQRLAMEFEIAIVLVMHFSKGAKNPDDALAGSHQWRAAARSILHLLRDPEKPDERLLIINKSSRSEAADQGLARRLRLVEDHAEMPYRDRKTGKVSRVLRKGLTVRELGMEQADAVALMNPRTEPQRVPLKRLDAKQIILNALEDGLSQWKEILAEFDGTDISRGTAREARDELLDHRVIDKKKEGGGPWVWFKVEEN